VIQERIRTVEQRRSYTDLIDSIAVTAQNDDVAFRRIRVRADEIRRWFAERTDWPTLQTRDMVRVIKTPASATSSQGFSWVSSPLDYELFVWVLWYEEVLESNQFVCSELVRELEAQISNAVAPDHFSWDRSEHRLSLERAVDALVSMAAIRRVDGSIGEYARDETQDALYEFTGVARHLHITLPRDIDHATRTGEFGYLSVASEAVPAETRLYRALILSPALYAHHDREAFDLLRGRDKRATIAADLKEHLGWDLEVTGSYACLLRPAGKRQSSAGFPRTNAAIMHVVLLLCGRLREIAQTRDIEPDRHDRIAMTRGRFLSELIDLRAKYGANWGKGLSEEEIALDGLAALTLSQCHEWGLVEDRDEEGLIHFLPLTARYMGNYTDEAIATFEEDADEE
jgi:uncharacterized protein (TIGR02678 family)